MNNQIKNIKKHFYLTNSGDCLSNNKEIVVIGCGAAGGTAAQFARKTNRDANITVIEKEKYPEYSKCGIPYTISEIIPKISNLIEFSEDWFENSNINLMLNTEVESIDTNKKIVFAKKGNEKIEKSYDSLIICTGADPVSPPIENLFENDKLSGRAFFVRTLDDAKNISSYVKKHGNAAIIGAGLIGLEMADNLNRMGMNVTVIEALPTILANSIDSDMSKIVHEKISEHVTVYTDHVAIKVDKKNENVNKLYFKDNQTDQLKDIETDLLIIAIGAKPNVKLAKKIGCKIGKTGSVVVNEKSETSVDDVYSAGDCTEYVDIITGRPVWVGLASIAVRQAISAGINASGGSYKYLSGVLQTRTSEFFDLEIAAVGPISKNLSDFSAVSGRFVGSSRLSYFPGGEPISIKVIVNRDNGHILAAQAVGANAAQRINTLACAILGNIDVDTFRKMETAYAPPIAPTLDAISIVCDIVARKLKQKK